MKNIEISLRSDYVNNTGDCFHMVFNFDDEEELRITSFNTKDKTQHDFALTKDDYLFLREQFDKHFNAVVTE